MSAHPLNTVIVGGGQAGLAVSYYLPQQGREHIVLERAPKIADVCRNQRWDSFTLVTPNFQVRMLAPNTREMIPTALCHRSRSSPISTSTPSVFGFRCVAESKSFLSRSVGLPWLHSRKSGILFGVGEDAAYIAERIAARHALAEIVAA